MRVRGRPKRTRPRVIFRRNTNMTATIESQRHRWDSPLHETYRPSIPHFFTSEPAIRDLLETDTSHLQDQTVAECLPFLTGAQHDDFNAYLVPHLDRPSHVRFLHRQLGKLPAGFMSADPSRPWFFYWCLAALSLLGEDVSSYRHRLVETARPMQNAAGGFAGGFGQTSHLATTYATVLSLALVGGEEAYEMVDRRAMWKWLSSLKQPDGGFQMALGGEEDVRYATCPAIRMPCHPNSLGSNAPLAGAPTAQPSSSRYSTSLLICHPTHLHALLATLACLRALPSTCAAVSLCPVAQKVPSVPPCSPNKGQTYEGGVSAKPGVEAHGAYAFCALGCLSIIDSPHRSILRYVRYDPTRKAPRCPLKM